MYKFPLKLKIGAIVLMVVGLVFTAISFLSAPKTTEEVEELLKHQTHGHHATHDKHVKDDVKHVEKKHEHKAEEHNVEDHKSVVEEVKSEHKVEEHKNVAEVKESEHKVAEKHETKVADAKTVESEKDTVEVKTVGNFIVNTYKKDKDLKSYQAPFKVKSHAVTSHAHTQVKHVHTAKHEAHKKHDAHADHEKHVEHVFHQLQNKPVAAFYVALLFFLGVTLLVMAFYAGQRIAQSGWSVVLFRVFEAITNNLHYVSVVMLLFIILTAMHKFHLFPWMKEGTLDPTHENYDSVIYGKKWWMNIPGWTIRSVIYLTIWNVLRLIIRKMSIKQDNGDLKLHKRLFNLSVAFLATFLITESMMSWDWIMGIDPHWFSTLFGWYVLATFLVSAMTIVAMVTIYLRSTGALPLVNDSHIHDLVKFMFGFSVFWTYLWFAQFMLVWYSDMPEETTYFVQRFNEYKYIFLGMIPLNFILPVLILINSDFKSIPWIIITAGVFILVGHYIDLYVMIMPGTVGSQYGFGFGEIGGILFFVGLFIYATFSAFAKADTVAKGSPFLHESETFHYYIIEHRGEDKDHH